VAASALSPFLPSRPSVVLGYHRVVEQFDQEARSALQGSLISGAMLERHLDALGRRFRFVSLDELVAGERDGSDTRPVAAVTFDDGYRDVYEHGFPLLVRKGIPATIFVVSDLVGTTEEHTHDRLHRLVLTAKPRWAAPVQRVRELLAEAGVPEPFRSGLARRAVGEPATLTRALLTGLWRSRLVAVVAQLEAEVGAELPPLTNGALPLTREMLCAMDGAGITIGSHTRRHALLPNEDPAVLKDEVAGSRHRLESSLGHPVTHFAYPDGAFNRQAVEAVAAAGYRSAFTTCVHRDPVHPELTRPRLVMWEHSAVDPRGVFSERIFRCQVHGVLTWRRDCTWTSHA
jgi:peptidoglycan/xylan/chitin deacetylase (PgdA/CDA1 family)